MTRVCACVVRRFNVIENKMCTYDDANVCSMHAGLLGGRFALVVATGIRVHFVAAVFARGAKKFIVLHLYHVLASLTDDVCADAL